MKLADDDFDIDAEVVLAAEDFEYTPARILGGRGPIRDLDINDDSLQIVPFGVEGGFVAKHAVDGFLLAIKPRRLASFFDTRNFHARAESRSLA